ncbi:Ppx/GppA family phosphatase [Schaalia sp. 19OD2882]|uniref:Ppx/GppA phosphatase family protein n=1 Tax=Schaalia sp. 19OD2882 TaxID=2794089 RepID=UPI001C1F1463|nr:Ppx/GppA phosphatase family protein [Schaalia sp. 19OD2882]QWW20189.1 Ppx/GppA family phosphatase [Schaalia sp. 19OD2882]
MTRIAAIDCGTNSIRLLVADADSRDGRPVLHDLTRQMRIVRLGQGVDRSGVLAPEAIERTMTAVREYKGIIDEFGCRALRFVSTSAVRDASNREDFIGAVVQVLGIEPEVVPGHEEAALSFAGAVSGVAPRWPRPLMVVDIGGGSTELVLGRTSVDCAISVDMGSVRVTEKFFHDCHPEAGIPAAAEARAITWIDERLDEAAAVVDLTKVGTLVGVAGTVTTVTAQALGLVDYQPSRIDGAVLTLEEIRKAVRFMVDEPVSVKAALGFMPRGRADVIAGGALIWSRIVERVAAATGGQGRGIDRVLTSEHDILDGIALSLL